MDSIRAIRARDRDVKPVELSRVQRERDRDPGEATDDPARREPRRGRPRPAGGSSGPGPDKGSGHVDVRA